MCKLEGCKKTPKKGREYCPICLGIWRKRHLIATKRLKKAVRFTIGEISYIFYKDENETYKQRNELLSKLGYRDYTQYLSSNLWKEIYLRVMLDRGNRCILCNNQTNILHHISYRRSVLLGEDDSFIVPLCNSCHMRIEFTKKGVKRDVCTVQEQLGRIINKKNKYSGV